MASSVIHLSIGKRLNEKLKKDYEEFMLGCVAPDLGKLVGEGKLRSHFLDSDDTNIPNIDKFLRKYINKLDDSFILGYYVHLFTDYLWFKYFFTELYDPDKSCIKDSLGEEIKLDEDTFCEYIYNDYTNLNIKLIEKYDLDLEFFYSYKFNIDSKIEELPLDKIKILTDKICEIVENTKYNKTYLFDLSNIDNFVDLSVRLILAHLKELSVIK